MGTNAGVEPVVIAPFAVALDWLTLDMRASQPRTFERMEPWPFTSHELAPGRQYVLRPTLLKTPVFRTVAYIEDERGEKLATITADPHNTVCGPAEWFQVQFANATLYSGEWMPLFRILRYAWGCTFNAISRVDIATDGLAGDGGDFGEPIQRSWTGDVRYYGKADWRPRMRRAKVEGAEFGTRASNKFMRAYDKTRELKQVKRKPHVESLWTIRLGRNPMHTGEQVNRLELQVKGKEVRRYFHREDDPLWVEQLGQPERLVDLFASMVPKMFDFRTAADRARDAVPVVRWDWSRIAAASPDLAERAPRNYAMSEHQCKVALKAMWRVAIVTADDAAWTMCDQWATAWGPHMVQWFQRQRVHWERELHRLAASDPHALQVMERLADGTELKPLL